MAIDPKNLAGTATMTFADEFNTLSLVSDTGGTWDSNYWWGKPNGTTLTNNGEQQWYIDHTYAATQSIKPWVVQDGVLNITAQNAAPEIQSQIDGYQYTSGMLTTHESFSQQYGYFEVSAKLPDGQGLWPAFWLLPQDGGWPPEIDVMEQLGHDMTTYYTAAHTQSSGSHTSQGAAIPTPDLSASFHTYGVNWQPDNLTYYFDGQEVWKTATPSDMDSPMYLLVNLAVGGYWPGSPNPDPNFSETMQVDYIRAYTAKPDGEVTNTAPTTNVLAETAPIPTEPVASGNGPTQTTETTPAPSQPDVTADASTSGTNPPVSEPQPTPPAASENVQTAGGLDPIAPVPPVAVEQPVVSPPAPTIQEAFDFATLPSASGCKGKSFSHHDSQDVHFGWSHGKGHDRHEKHDEAATRKVADFIDDDAFDVSDLAGAGLSHHHHHHHHAHTHGDHWSV